MLFGGITAHISSSARTRAGKGLQSAGLRMLTPVVGLGLGVVASQCAGSSRCDNTPLVIGGATGALIASVIDGAVFAYEEKAPRATTALRLVPTLVPLPQGVELGVAGTFEPR